MEKLQRKWVVIEREYDGYQTVDQLPIDGRLAKRVCECEFEFCDEAERHLAEGECYNY